ncbi:hypothetical protein [Methylocucumis oryzae]|uniref:hypothetical protein n=1 Tax=Methylocucumis oryzae TaxID=1632867 RepID=UPI00195530FC|nr:hypothetical protein [Methylocucumis oryzae]
MIASFFECDKNGDMVQDKDGNPASPIVEAPLTESNLDASFNWQSAFESMSPESKAPMLFAMLQSGAIQPVIDALSASKVGSAVGGLLGSNAGQTSGNAVTSAQQQSGDFLKQFEGRTGITKLNSTQIFSGMPPVKIQLTLLFRAWQDPVSEVEDPLDQLLSWAFPQRLANDSLIANLIKAAQGEANPIEALLPSQSPKLIAFVYKNRKYAPMVIEQIGIPLSSPIDSNGNFVELLLPVTLGSLTAWDKDDWANTRY